MKGLDFLWACEIYKYKGRIGRGEKIIMENQTKVLLIEDNPGDQRLVQETLRELEHSSYQLEFADDLTSGIDKLVSGDYDVVLLDLNLPDSDGLETLDQVRGRFRDIPIVVMTGQDDEEQALEALQRGAQDYQIKGQLGGMMLSRVLSYAMERKRMELAVKNVGEYYLEFIDGSSDMMFSLNREGKFVYVNKRWCELMGYSREESGGKRFSDILRRDQVDAHGNIFRDLAEGKNIRRVETVFVRKDGVDLFVAGDIKPRMKDGRLVAAQGIFQDVSEIKRVKTENDRLFEEIAELKKLPKPPSPSGSSG